MPAILVGGNGAGDDDAACPGDALYQTEGNKLQDGLRIDAADGRQEKKRHGSNQRRTAAVLVAQRPEEKLADSKPNHASRESKLHHRGACDKILGHCRQCGEVHVRNERPESRHHA